MFLNLANRGKIGFQTRGAVFRSRKMMFTIASSSRSLSAAGHKRDQHAIVFACVNAPGTWRRLPNRFRMIRGFGAAVHAILKLFGL